MKQGTRTLPACSQLDLFPSDANTIPASPSLLVPQSSPTASGSFLYLIDIAEFWTSRQRQGSSIHEISYRACFKPQLPAYFISRYTKPGDIVYDPFAGRGTTAIEAALHGRRAASNDVNPLSRILTQARLELPRLDAIRERMDALAPTLAKTVPSSAPDSPDLSMFYEEKTLAEILSLRRYLHRRRANGTEDAIDRWLRMVATNRLTGHSPGFFSVYTLPPNQAASPRSQIEINRKRRQTPPYRDVMKLIWKKTRQLFSTLTPQETACLRRAARDALFFESPASSTPALPGASVALTVTSPPFLDVVQYAQDNWLRCWFNHIDTAAISPRLTMSRTLDVWTAFIRDVFVELFRVTKPGGHVAFEVGEVRNGTIRLEEAVVPAAESTGFCCKKILINTQSFTKTANIWGIKNNTAGTNTNRIVLLKKPA